MNNNGNKGSDSKPKKLTVEDLKKVIGGAVEPAPTIEQLSEDTAGNKVTQKIGAA